MENKAATGSYVTSQTSVWWDIDSSPVPAGYDPSLVGPSVHLALEKLGYRGPITITAVGKLKRTSEDVMRAISSTGITVKYGGLGCKSTCAELLHWRLMNPAPATIMFISSSSVLEFFSGRLGTLPKQYNMLLAYGPSLPEKDPELVTSAEWRWESLLNEAMGSDGKLEAKRQILKDEKRSNSLMPFTCTLCHSAWRSLEAFTTHLQCLDHEVIKFGRRANSAYLDTLSQDSLEKELEVNRTCHLLKQKKQWEELKKKLQESGRSASQVYGEMKKRYEIYWAKERSSLRKIKHLKSQHEQGTELEIGGKFEWLRRRG